MIDLSLSIVATAVRSVTDAVIDTTAPVVFTTDIASYTITEGSVTTSTVIANVTATDSDGGTITYSVRGSVYATIATTGGDVTLTAAGVTLVNTGEDVPAFTVKAVSENSNGSVTVTPVSTTQVDDAVVITHVDATSITEESVDTSTVITTISATDEDGTDIAYTLGDSTYLDIDSDSGVVTLNAAGVTLVDGGSDVPSFTVTATSTTSTADVTITPVPTTTVNDALELSVVTADTITQNSESTSTVIATATATDEDGAGFTYSISGDDNGYYAVTGNVIYLSSDGVTYVNTGADLPSFFIVANSTTSADKPRDVFQGRLHES